jgi:hypothetical protein
MISPHFLNFFENFEALFDGFSKFAEKKRIFRATTCIFCKKRALSAEIIASLL